MGRRSMLMMVIAVGMAAAACQQLLGLQEPERRAPIDAIADGGSCLTASAECVGDTLRVCAMAGDMPVDTQCAWGCVAETESHCGVLHPAGGDGLVAADLDPSSSLADATFGDEMVIDSDTGRIGTVIMPDAIRAAGEGVSNGIDFELRDDVAIFRSSRVIVQGLVRVIGGHAVAIVGIEGITIEGTLDARGTCASNVAGPGGFQGGDIHVTASGSGGGSGTSMYKAGGGGGGYRGVGGAGGGGAAGGAMFGVSGIMELTGGGGGGGGGGGAQSGVGGGGGGAVQLVSNGAIAVTANGGINAGGCGGKHGSGANDGGGGGGAGGTILIEAPTVMIDGILAANGGAGGGTGAGGAGGGENGRLDDVLAASIVLQGQAGGSGAASSQVNGLPGTEDSQAGGGGGGGGGIGRIRINARTPTIAAGAVTSPNASIGNGNVK